MDKTNLDDSLKETLVELKQYLEVLFAYNKLLLAKKMGEVSSFFMLFLIVFGLSSFALLFLSLALAEWLSHTFQLPYMGNLITAGIYLLFILILVAFRKQLIFNPLRGVFGKIFFEDDEDKEINIEEIFKSDEGLVIKLKAYRMLMKEKQVDLNQKLNDLGEELTISNIFQTIFKNIYTTLFTTTNVIRFAFQAVRSLTSRKKRSRKSKKNRLSDRKDEGEDD